MWFVASSFVRGSTLPEFDIECYGFVDNCTKDVLDVNSCRPGSGCSIDIHYLAKLIKVSLLI